MMFRDKIPTTLAKVPFLNKNVILIILVKVSSLNKKNNITIITFKEIIAATMYKRL